MSKYQRLTIQEREAIITSLSQVQTLRSISSVTGRNVSTISREVVYYQSDFESYSAQVSHSDALFYRSIPRRKSKIDSNPKLLKFIRMKLAHQWSPEQISRELKKQFPDDRTMNVSHEKNLHLLVHAAKRGAAQRTDRLPAARKKASQLKKGRK